MTDTEQWREIASALMWTNEDAANALYEAADTADRLQARIATLEAQYHELLFAVGNKHPGETRHQTALRYIQQAERRPVSEGQADRATAALGDNDD